MYDIVGKTELRRIAQTKLSFIDPESINSFIRKF